MAEVIELSDADFAEQMLGLVNEAMEGRNAPVRSSEKEPSSTAVSASGNSNVAPVAPKMETASTEIATPSPAQPSLTEMMRPLLLGLQAMSRTTGEHGQILSRLDQAVAESTQASREMPQVVAELRAITDHRNNVSRQMFDALHEELKSYKDGFLLDTVHRPMIRDLITLYDDLSTIHQQMQEPIETASRTMQGQVDVAAFAQRLINIGLHIEHNLDFILEVLARLDVSQIPLVKGKLDKTTQRAVAVEPAEDPDDDLTIVKTLKRGFLWKERVVRAEEVVIRKWKEGFLMALKSTED